MGAMLLVVLAVFGTGSAGVAQVPRIADERAVQAIFLLHFTRFVDWPPSAFESRDDPFRICVIGDDPFGDVLDRAVGGEKAAGRDIEVERYRQPDEALACQMAYLSDGVRPERLHEIPGFEEGLVLTVGRTEAFFEHGGLLRFVSREGTVGLAVNEQARQRSRLHLSSKLLQISELQRPEPDPDRERDETS